MNKFEKISLAQFEKDGGNKEQYDQIKLPKRATRYSAGYDIFAYSDITIEPGATIKYATGLRILLDKRAFLALVPRSGLGFKFRLQLDNTIGIIDADYSDSSNEGHFSIKLTNDTRDNKTVHIRAGEAIVQGIIMQYMVTDDDEATEIRDGGLGSTSK